MSPRQVRVWQPIRRLENQRRGEIPLPFLLGWIKVESGGRLKEVTSLGERGYFQLMGSESKQLKLDHGRLSSDSAYSVDAGIQLIRHYASRAEAAGFTRGTDLFWRMVKFQHAMGPGAVRQLLADMREHGAKPSSWAAVKAFAATDRKIRKYHPLKSAEPH